MQKTATNNYHIGERALLLYSFATYLPQFVLHFVDEEVLNERFRIGTGTQKLAAFIPLFLLLVFALQRWLPRVSLTSHGLGRIAGRVFESWLNTVFAVVLIGLAIHFSLTEGISFRQSGDILSEAGISVALLMFCKPYIYAWLMYHFLLAIRGYRYRQRRARTQATLFLVVLILSLTGSLDVLPIAWAILFIFCNPGRLQPIFLSTRRSWSIFRKTLMLIVVVPVAAAIVGVIVSIGYINKTGVDRFGDLISRIGIDVIAEQTMVRASSSYASVISFAHRNLFNLLLYEDIVAVPMQNIPYRMSLILGDPIPRPTITQITVLNYRKYDQEDYLERAGASPGLVASGFYAGPFPLGFLVMALYAVLVVRVVNLPFAKLPARPKFGLVALCISFIYPLFESPVDYLIFIDPAFLQLVLVVTAFVAASVSDPPRSGIVLRAADDSSPYASGHSVSPVRS